MKKGFVVLLALGGAFMGAIACQRHDPTSISVTSDKQTSCSQARVQALREQFYNIRAEMPRMSSGETCVKLEQLLQATQQMRCPDGDVDTLINELAVALNDCYAPYGIGPHR